MNDGPIIVVDDDDDDREFLHEAWANLNYKNDLIFMDNGDDVLDYLKSGKKSPFIILCDVNLPRMSGFELKAKICEDQSANYKSIPFVFWSNVASTSQIQKAYDLGGNGFFLKGDSLDQIKKSLINIVNYWLNSKVPD